MQRKALTELLFNFGKRAAGCGDDLMKMHALADEQSVALANVMNAQTAAVLVSFHVLFKNEISRIINDCMDKSGTSIIEAFKAGHKFKGDGNGN